MSSAEYFWTVPADHPAFAGHFPGQPIVPGVVLLDQAILYAEQFLGLPVAQWQIANAKFLSPVGPMEVLTFVLEQKTSGAIVFSVRAAERTVASGNLTPATP